MQLLQPLKNKVGYLKHCNSGAYLIAVSKKHSRCVCAFRSSADQSISLTRCFQVCDCRAVCPHAIPRSLPPTHVIYSEEQPQRLCATVTCHRCNLSPRRADQRSKPPPHRGHRIVLLSLSLHQIIMSC